MSEHPPHQPLTLMAVHAHPDDETIGTGGVMARYVSEGRRVVLVTCTDGAMGEIVIPQRDTPEEHRRLAATRAGELEAAMAVLGVTEWESLGYRDSDMMGRPGNLDPRSFWQADMDEAIGRLVWLIRRHRPHVITTYNDFGGYGHPDHIRTHLVAVGAWERAGDAGCYPQQLAPEHGGSGPSEADGGLAPWAPLKLYEQAIPASVRATLRDRMRELGHNPWNEPGPGATDEERAAYEAFMAKLLVPDERVTTKVDVNVFLDAKFAAMRAHATQLAPDFPFLAVGVEGWREFWPYEAFILRGARVETAAPEDDLFAGLD
jgi:N-acetyl-1-D-myo-inositol-2-amino-2-deoxy-alpha-D-glucopyranoside deacetylase